MTACGDNVPKSVVINRRSDKTHLAPFKDFNYGKRLHELALVGSTCAGVDFRIKYRLADPEKLFHKSLRIEHIIFLGLRGLRLLGFQESFLRLF